MGRLDVKRQLKQARARRVRNVIRGDSQRPRLSIFVSARSLQAQAIDDSTGKTLVGMKTKDGKDIKAAAEFAKTFAAAAKKAKISKLVVDRGSRKYHGRLKAFVDGLRKEGLEL